jgi:hypothetical protein
MLAFQRSAAPTVQGAGNGGNLNRHCCDELHSDCLTGVMDVDKLLLDLEHNLESAKLSLKRTSAATQVFDMSNDVAELENLLGEAKIAGRDVNTAGPIFSARVSYSPLPHVLRILTTVTGNHDHLEICI